MQIEIKGRNVPVPDDLRRHAERRLTKVSRQVSKLARLEIELLHERNPRVADSQVAEATLYLKGTTLRARDASPQMLHSLNLVVDELARQVKRHRVMPSPAQAHDARRRMAAHSAWHPSLRAARSRQLTAHPQSLPWGRVHPGSRPQRRRGEEVQAVREARRADRRVRARARTRQRRGAA